MAYQTPSESDPLLSSSSQSTPNNRSDPSAPTSYGSSNADHSDPKATGSDEEASGQPSDEDNPLFVGLPDVKKKLVYILPAIGIGVFLAAADQTIIVAAYGKIGSELNALNNSSWIATA